MTNEEYEGRMALAALVVFIILFIWWSIDVTFFGG